MLNRYFLKKHNDYKSMVLISSRGLVLEFVERCTIDFLCFPLLSGNMVSRVEQSTAVHSVVNECLVDS